jgi:long-chain acyl-CoA synthetase
MRLLTDILYNNLERHPGKRALAIKPKYRTTTWSYAELFQFARGVAKFLEARGTEKGDRVILWASNSPHWLGTFFGCLLRGVIVVPMHTENTAEFIQKVVSQTEPKVFFKSSDLSMEGVDWVDIDSMGDYTYARGLTPHIDEDDIAEILYTSGTTGEPKGVILTHKNIVSNLNAVWGLIPIAKGDRVLSLLPLSHIFEQAVEFRVLAAGAFIVYAPALASSVIRKTLKKYRVNKLAAVPEFLKRVMTRIESEAGRRGRGRVLRFLFSAAGAVNMRPLRRLIFSGVHRSFGGKLALVVSGGATLDAELAKKWQALGVNISQGYGLTETASAATLLAAGDSNIWSVGKAVFGVEIKIGEDGEILLRGPSVTRGYYKNEEKTKEAFTRDGWFRTGDLGYMDKNGYLYIRGRKKFMILTASGQNVYPEDIEEELNKESEVKDSAVVGLERDGATLIHAELLGRIRDAAAIIARVNKRLASFQQIQSWSVWPFEDFPRTITRKVKRQEVLDYLKNKKIPQFMQGAEGGVSPLLNILSGVLNKPASALAKDARIAALGLDSLARIELVARIEEELGAEIDEAQITPVTTVGELETLVAKKPLTKIKYKLSRWPRHPLIRQVREIVFYLLVRPLFGFFMDVKVEGAQNIPYTKEPAIFMSNHISDLDGPAIYLALPRRMRRNLAVATATDVLFEKFWYIQPLATLLFNSYPFPRKGQTRLGFEYTGELMDQGWSILIFPEGRIYADPVSQLRLMEGAGVAAVEMRSPLVPVKIEGADSVMLRGVHFPKRRAKVTVRFGKPLSFDSKTPYREATQMIRAALAAL